MFYTRRYLIFIETKREGPLNSTALKKCIACIKERNHGDRILCSVHSMRAMMALRSMPYGY